MRLLVVKLLFHLRHGLLLQSSIEQVGSLNVRPVFASNDLLSVLTSFAKQLMPYSPKGDSGKGKSKGERMLTVFVNFP